MEPEKSPTILDYGRPPLRDARWFRLLVLFGCLLGIGTIIAMLVDIIRFG